VSQKQHKLTTVNDQLLIHVWDNGTGFDTNKYNTIEGFGLKLMPE
jgi:signal transduction histidine kinase